MTPEQIEEIIKPFKADFKKRTESLVRTMFVKGTDPNLVNQVVAMMTSTSPKVAVSAQEEMKKISYPAAPPKINVPVWALNSDLWPTKPKINRKYVPEFNLRIMSGCGHFLMLESPDEFNRQLSDIIETVTHK